MIPEVHERLPHTKGMITGPKISMVEGRLSASIKDSFFLPPNLSRSLQFFLGAAFWLLTSTR